MVSSVQVVTVEITIDSATISLQEVQLQTVSIVHTYLQGEGALVAGSVSFSVYIGITISTGENPEASPSPQVRTHVITISTGENPRDHHLHR